MKAQYKTIDQYIKMFPGDIQAILEDIRRTVHEVAPEAKELISYRMPAFRLKSILVYFAAHKNHIGFYPTHSGIEAFKKELVPYKWSKGAVQFPLNRPIPFELIRKMVAFRLNEDTNKTGGG